MMIGASIRSLLPCIFRALDHRGSKALLAVPLALATEVVVGDPVSVVEKDCLFVLSLFAHPRYRHHPLSWVQGCGYKKTREGLAPSYVCKLSGENQGFFRLYELPE